LLFSSIIFLCLFFPVFISIYFLIPGKHRNLWLFIGSMIFYMWGEKLLVLVMLFTILVNYMAGILVDKGYCRSGLMLSLTASLGCLFYFKYANFTYDNIVALLHMLGVARAFHPLPQVVLPLGISFYIFQTISYTIDVYRGHIKATRNLLSFATYVGMFPHLMAGPIVRYADIAAQLEQVRRPRAVMISEGLERLIIGLAKKMFIANTFAAIADTVFGLDLDFISPGVAWIGILAYTFQIYFDFSAYSDMAIGMARVLGIRFLENFNYPYIAASVREFWRRWHISLSSWFRDYVYIPLGGNRKGARRTYLNLLVVFFVTGLWHGASWNFVVWGLWHGLFIVIERLGFGQVLERLWRPVRHLYTLLVVVVGWVFFRADTLAEAVTYLKRMFVWNAPADQVVFYPPAFFNRETAAMFIIAVLFSMPLFPAVRGRLEAVFSRFRPALAVYYAGLFGMLYVIMMYLSVDTYNPFIYFRF